MEVMEMGEVQQLLTVDDVAQMLGVPVKTVYVWRTRGVGPRGIRVGRYLRYRQADVETWLDEQQDGAPAA